jgi:hypothetical protein
MTNNGKSRHLCLIPDFRINGFLFWPCTMMLTKGLSYIVSALLMNVLTIYSL